MLGLVTSLMFTKWVELAAHEVLVIVSQDEMDLSTRIGDTSNACADASAPTRAG